MVCPDMMRAMRVFKLALFLFVFSLACMPLLNVAHDLAHEKQALNSQTHWTEFGHWESSALIQFVGDDAHHDNEISIDSDRDGVHSAAGDNDGHHCHHFSLFGMATHLTTPTFSTSGALVHSRMILGSGRYTSPLDYPPRQT